MFNTTIINQILFLNIFIYSLNILVLLQSFSTNGYKIFNIKYKNRSLLMFLPWLNISGLPINTVFILKWYTLILVNNNLIFILILLLVITNTIFLLFYLKKLYNIYFLNNSINFINEDQSLVYYQILLNFLILFVPFNFNFFLNII